MRCAKDLRALALRPGGFTLVELLVAMAILASLAAILVPIIASGRRVAKVAATRNLLMQIEAAIERFSENWGYYPPDKLPSGTDLKRFDAAGAGTGESTYTTYTSSESPAQALYYTLCNPYVTGISPYLELSDKEAQTTGPSVIPKIVDRWDNPFNYNRKRFANPTYLPLVFSDKSGNAYNLYSFDDGSDPTHNPGSYDLWSRGPTTASGAQHLSAQWITNWK